MPAKSLQNALFVVLGEDFCAEEKHYIVVLSQCNAIFTDDKHTCIIGLYILVLIYLILAGHSCRGMINRYMSANYVTHTDLNEIRVRR